MSLRLVLDASPLILLGKIGRLDLLRALAKRIVVPRPVVEELAAGGALDDVARRVRRSQWLAIVPGSPTDDRILAWDLGPGESAVLSYCLHHPGFIATIDDRAARRCAQSLAISTIGTLGLLLAAKSAGLIPRVKPVLEKLLQGGLYVSGRTLEALLVKAGEE